MNVQWVDRQFIYTMFKLVMVDTTAAPALYIVGYRILSRCVDVWNIPIHDEDFHTYSIQ